MLRRNSPDHNAKGTPSHSIHPVRTIPGSDRLYAHGFRFCFTRRQAFFSPFPHGTLHYRSQSSYLALEDGPPRFNRGFTCPDLLGYPSNSSPTRLSHYGTLTLSGAPSQAPSASTFEPFPRAITHNPGHESPHNGLGSSPFRSPLLRESQLISLPPGT